MGKESLNMKISRRDLKGLLPLLAASRGSSQTRRTALLHSRLYHSSEIAYNGDDKKKARQFFRGGNRSGFDLEMHETILGEGMQTHAPHKHEHEEIVIAACP